MKADAGERLKPKPIERSTPQFTSGSATDVDKLVRRQKNLSETLQRLFTSLREVNISAQSNSFRQLKIQARNKYWREVEELHLDIGFL